MLAGYSQPPSLVVVDRMWLGWPRHMALDHMPARPCATASEPQATSGARTAHTATRPSAIPAAVLGPFPGHRACRTAPS
jgi:hypothetical protein